MQTTRRDFLRQGLGSSVLISSAATVPAFVARSAALLAADAAPANSERVLVVIELNGGNDGLNTIVPYADEQYRRARPTLALSPENIRRIDDQVGLHPELAGFDKLLERRQLTVVQSVGYPNPNRSHFESMAIWQSGRLHGTPHESGWLARALDMRGASVRTDPAALHVGESATVPQTLFGVPDVLSLSGPEQFRRRVGVGGAKDDPRRRARLAELGRKSRGPRGTLLESVQQTAATTDAASVRFERLAELPGASYGDSQQTGLARRLAFISQMVRAGLATRIYHTELSGFDTHVNQAGMHARLLGELGDSLQAFISDLDAAGEAERVLVLAFSEFGRRLGENASAGTDHGTAAPVFLASGAMRYALLGPAPNLSELDADGDPKYAIDFREVYAAVLDGWLACPSSDILGEKIGPLRLF